MLKGKNKMLQRGQFSKHKKNPYNAVISQSENNVCGGIHRRTTNYRDSLTKFWTVVVSNITHLQPTVELHI